MSSRRKFSKTTVTKGITDFKKDSEETNSKQSQRRSFSSSFVTKGLTEN